MITAYFVAGVLTILVMSSYRYIVLRQRGGFHHNLWALISIPKNNDDRGQVLIAITQGMGLLWILQGIFWMVIEDKLSGNIIEIFIEGFGIFIPPVLGIILLKVLTRR